jgi:hypothetical protein
MANELIRPIDADAGHAIDWPRQPSVGLSSDSRLIAALPRTATGGQSSFPLGKVRVASF